MKLYVYLLFLLLSSIVVTSASVIGEVAIEGSWEFELLEEDDYIEPYLEYLGNNTFRINITAKKDIPKKYEWDASVCTDSMLIKDNFKLIPDKQHNDWCKETDGLGFEFAVNLKDRSLPLSYTFQIENVSEFYIYGGNGSFKIGVTGGYPTFTYAMHQFFVMNSSGGVSVFWGNHTAGDEKVTRYDSSDNFSTYRTTDIFKYTDTGYDVSPELYAGIFSNGSYFVAFTSPQSASLKNITYLYSEDGNTWSHSCIVPTGGKQYELQGGFVDQHDVVHFTIKEEASDDLYYINSSGWSLVTVNTDDADDSDYSDVVVAKDGCVYVYATGSDNDDLEVWSPCLSGWGNNNEHMVLSSTSAGNVDVDLSENDTVFISVRTATDIKYLYSYNFDTYSTVSFSGAFYSASNSVGRRGHLHLGITDNTPDAITFYNATMNNSFASQSDWDVLLNHSTSDTGYVFSMSGEAYPSFNRQDEKVWALWAQNVNIKIINFTNYIKEAEAPPPNNAPTITLNYPTANGYYYETNMSVNFSTGDADGDNRNVTLYVNSTFNQTSINAVNISDLNMSNGTYSIVLSVTDGVDTSSNTSVVQFQYGYQVWACVPDRINESWTAWFNTSVCGASDTTNKTRNVTEYDQNYCAGSTNVTYFENSTDSCDFCQYNWVNSTWELDTNETCHITDEMNTTWNITSYDSNYSSCYLITGIEADRYNSGNNITYQIDNQTWSCNYCSYNWINTTWVWNNNNSCLANSTMETVWNITSWDSNYTSCYLQTSIEADRYNSGNNITYQKTNQTWNCDYCAESVTNTSWVNVENSTCQIDDWIDSIWNRTEYDSNQCSGGHTNITYQVTNHTYTCNYCSYNVINTTGSWVNATCLSNSTWNQSNTTVEWDTNYTSCYLVTSLATDLWNNGDNKSWIIYQNVNQSCTYSNASTSGEGGGTPPPEDLEEFAKSKWYEQIMFIVGTYPAQSFIFILVMSLLFSDVKNKRKKRGIK